MPVVDDEMIALPMEQAAKLADVPRYRLRYWDMTNLVRPGISRRISVRNHVRLYTFNDLTSLLVIGELRRRDVSARQVRQVIEHLRALGIQHPAALGTADREVFFKYPDGEWRGAWSGGKKPGQLVFHEIIPMEPIHARIREAVRRSPDTFGRIIRRRRVHGRKPIFDGTRIPVRTVLDWLENGFPPEEVLEAYPDLVEEDISAARRFASSAA